MLDLVGILEPGDVEEIEGRLSEKYAEAKERRQARFEDLP